MRSFLFLGGWTGQIVGLEQLLHLGAQVYGLWFAWCWYGGIAREPAVALDARP